MRLPICVESLGTDPAMPCAPAAPGVRLRHLTGQPGAGAVDGGRRRLFAAGCGLGWILAGCGGSDDPLATDERPVPYTYLGEHRLSPLSAPDPSVFGAPPYDQPMTYTLPDRASLEAFGKRAGGLPAQAVDFARQMVVGIYLGYRTNACVELLVTGAWHRSDGRIRLRYQQAVQGPGLGCVATGTWPGRLFVIDHPPAPVDFEQGRDIIL